MISRRAVLAAVPGLAAAARVEAADAADPFETLLAQAAANPAALAQARAYREGDAVEFGLRSDEDHMRSFRAFAPRVAASGVQVSPAAQQMIILFEVTNGATYTRRYQGPTWPGGQSGVTIGVGYDLSFIRREWLHEDWGGRLDAGTLVRLEPACLLKGPAAQAFCRSHGDIAVPWEAAQTQFLEVLLPRFITETLLALPQAQALSGDSLGALVSLTYNRGAAYRKAGGRYLEMREIWQASQARRFQTVPDDIAAMARLWQDDPGARGLVTRRQLEAALFRRGLGAGA